MNFLNILNYFFITKKYIKIIKCMEITNPEIFHDEEYYYNKQLLEKSCLLILAGGQGTRLDTLIPKGMVEIPLNNEITTTLFKLHFEKIMNINMKYEIKSNIIILCSEFTRKATEEYISSIYPYNVIYINQENEFCFNFNNEPIYKDENKTIQSSPNGNGGIFDTLEKNNIFNYFNERNIEILNVISVDNAKVNLLDFKVLKLFYETPNYELPSILISHFNSINELKYDIISKGVQRNEKEQAGIFITENNKLIIKEYSEFTKEFEETIKENTLINICNHYFSIKFLIKNKLNFKELEFHKAIKKIPYYDFNLKKLIDPKQPNGIKKEKFIFDIFKLTNNLRNIIFEVKREEEFLPLKNKDGDIDSLKSVKEGLLNK